MRRWTEPTRSTTRIPRRTRPKARKPGKPRRRAGACRPYLDWLKTQACRITGKQTGELGWQMIGEWRARPTIVTVDPAHVRVKRLGGDLWNAISLAHHLHEELHAHGIKTFAKKYNVDLKALAMEQTETWLATAEGRAWETGA